MPTQARIGSELETGYDRRTGDPSRLTLRLYVAASAPNSEQAEANLRALLVRAGIEDFALEIIDCIRDPLRALEDGVVVTPMLIKASPEPQRSIVGTLSDRMKVARALGIADRLEDEGADA